MESVFSHLVAQTTQNVELLIAHGQIPRTDGQEILSRLSASAARYAEDPSVASLAQKTQRLNVSPGPAKVEARAIWAWSSEDPNDLSFVAGETIEVIAETNADWWKGRSRSGKQGLFPSNYVEKLPPRNVESPILVPEPRSVASAPVQQRYASPALSPYAAPPQPYPAPPQQYYPSPVGPPPGAVSYSYPPPSGTPPAPQQEPEKKSKFGGLGQTMAQSAASGAGFGAGAAIGSGLVHSIF